MNFEFRVRRCTRRLVEGWGDRELPSHQWRSWSSKRLKPCGFEIETGIRVVVVVDRRRRGQSVDGVSQVEFEVERQSSGSGPKIDQHFVRKYLVLIELVIAGGYSRFERGAVDICAGWEADLGDHHAVSLETNTFNMRRDVYRLTWQWLRRTKRHAHAKLLVVDDGRGRRNRWPRMIEVGHELRGGCLRVFWDVESDIVTTGREG